MAVANAIFHRLSSHPVGSKSVQLTEEGDASGLGLLAESFVRCLAAEPPWGRWQL
jgi:hypothetical protein